MRSFRLASVALIVATAALAAPPPSAEAAEVHTLNVSPKNAAAAVPAMSLELTLPTFHDVRLMLRAPVDTALGSYALYGFKQGCNINGEIVTSGFTCYEDGVCDEDGEPCSAGLASTTSTTATRTTSNPGAVGSALHRPSLTATSSSAQRLLTR